MQEPIFFYSTAVEILTQRNFCAIVAVFLRSKKFHNVKFFSSTTIIIACFSLLFMQDVIPVRPAFWNVPFWAEVGLYIIGLAALVVCIAGIVRSVRLRRGNAPNPDVFPDAAARAKHMLKEIFLQPHIRKDGLGWTHFALFWGFFFLFLGTAVATIDWDVAHLVFGTRILKGSFYLAYKLVLDTAGLFALIALAIAAWRRFVSHDMRVEANSRFACVLGSLAFIIVSGFVLEALRLAVQQPAWAHFSFVGWSIAQIFTSMSSDQIQAIHVFVWVIHGLSALVFIAAIPLTYYGHIFKTPTSIFHHKPGPMGAVKKIDDIEEQESFGISNFDQFTRLDRLRLDGCTECGRCRGVCPAVKAGTPLDPKNLVLSLQARMRGSDADKPLIDGIVSKDALWSCTTCGACAKACPAEIPIPDMLVSMRRHLALEMGDFPEGLATALENTATVGNPWGMDPGSRLAWCKDLDVEKAKPGVEYDVLYWVGCSASYDRRAQKIARAMVKILKTAGIRFAVMAEERCHAEFARRAGEEYLFQTAAAENIENINRYSFKRILTACPHCFNTLKNEYPQFDNSSWPVENHVEFIAKLLEDKKITLKDAKEASVTLHDACYLARYNDVEKAPRRILIQACSSIDEAHDKASCATCCGAGGAQIFMDRPARINAIRLDELKAAGGSQLAVECPHCLTMLTSAQAQQNSQQPALKISDIAEIVARNLNESDDSSTAHAEASLTSRRS